MLAESTRGYLSVNTPALCIQARSEFRCGGAASTRSRLCICTTTTARFSVSTDVNSTACMRTSLVWKYVSVYWLTVHFFFLAQNGAIASIMNNIRYKVLEEAQFCDFCAGSLAIVLGHCTKCKTSLSVCYYWNMKYYLYSKADNMKYFVRGWLMSCWYLPLKQESRSFSKLYVSKSIRETHF